MLYRFYVCFSYHLLSFASITCFLFCCLYFPLLLTFFIFLFESNPVTTPGLIFISVYFVFDDLYPIDLVVVDLVLC